jgi:hypothetical protein
MYKYFFAVAMIVAALPPVAYAQVARNGNEYDYRDHQPTAAVQSQEQSAGVAPDAAQKHSETQELRQLDQHLQTRAQHDSQAVPQATQNVYGVQPGGVVHITPHAVAGEAGGSAAGK